MIYKYALMISLILAGGCGGGRLAAQDFLLQGDGCGCGGGGKLAATDFSLEIHCPTTQKPDPTKTRCVPK